MRNYETATGKLVPSVTTILNSASSEGIANWANYLGFRHIKYEEELNRRADRGTNVHSLLQAVVDPDNTQEVFEPSLNDFEYYDAMLTNFDKMISDYEYETVFTEQTIVSDSLGYGGTFDWLAKVNGHLMLFDFKSSSKVQIKHVIQLAAYRKLLAVERNIHIDGAAVIIANDKSSSMFVVNNTTLDYLGLAFDSLVVYHTSMNGFKMSQDLSFKSSLTAKNIP